MTPLKHDRLVTYVPATVRALGLIVLLGAVASVHAQQSPPYGGGSYPQPIQKAQNLYYGNYQDNRIPGYIYPRNQPTTNYGYNNGNGITYYYVENPQGQNFYPYGPATGTPPRNEVRTAPRADTRTPTWPAPVNAPSARVPYTPTEEELLGDGRKPVVSFHRPTNENLWLKADYLAHFVRPMRLPAGPLATTGGSGDAAPGALGQGNTAPIYGSSVDFGLQTGVRLEAGMFLDAENRFSVDFAGFYLIPTKQLYNTASDENGNPVISRPIFNVNTGVEGAFLNSLPGTLAGNLSIENKSEMWGVELNARLHGYIRERIHADTLIGFRYLRLNERLQITEQINDILPGFLQFQRNPVLAPNTLMDEDNFRTVNHFFGPQIGGRVSWEYDWLNVDAYAKMAVGPTIQQTTIQGTTTLVSPNGNQTANGGILALPSNIGAHRRTVLGIVPELGANVGITLCQHVRLNLGYSFLMWNHVVRPAGQIDRNVNPNQVPGSPTFGGAGAASAPTYRFNDEFFWTHTLKIGLEFHY